VFLVTLDQQYSFNLHRIPNQMFWIAPITQPTEPLFAVRKEMLLE
jgi:hypothetical protein